MSPGCAGTRAEPAGTLGVVCGRLRYFRSGGVVLPVGRRRAASLSRRCRGGRGVNPVWDPPVQPHASAAQTSSRCWPGSGIEILARSRAAIVAAEHAKTCCGSGATRQ